MFQPRDKTASTGRTIWDDMTGELERIIQSNRSTLIFTNSRRVCERITHKLNGTRMTPIAYAHHGSLSRDIRTAVEARLKAGELKAIVATNSLELGIDIGALDEVVMIQSPPTVSAAIQRAGRAGHGVGQSSNVVFMPTHGLDLITSAVLARAVVESNIESIQPVECPLDVLAQILVSMTAMSAWDLDELFARVRTSYPYRNLERERFDDVLNMLSGRYAHSRIPDLQPRVTIDRTDNVVRARPGAVQALYSSGGTIPDRGYYTLRHADTGARIGELDEEYVWEARAGQLMTLGIAKLENSCHFA